MSKSDRSDQLNEALSYRSPMRVTTVHRLNLSSWTTTFPICPRCQQIVAREYQDFCNQCGQALSWKGFSKAKIIDSC